MEMVKDLGWLHNNGCRTEDSGVGMQCMATPDEYGNHEVEVTGEMMWGMGWWIVTKTCDKQNCKLN